MYNTTCEFIDLLLNIYSFISFIISFTIFFLCQEDCSLDVSIKAIITLA